MYKRQQINRKKGLEQALKGSNIEIIYNQTSNWEKEQALKIVEDLIQKKMEFNVVICQDDNSATGAGQALKEAGMKEDCLLYTSYYGQYKEKVDSLALV